MCSDSLNFSEAAHVVGAQLVGRRKRSPGQQLCIAFARAVQVFRQVVCFFLPSPKPLQFGFLTVLLTLFLVSSGLGQERADELVGQETCREPFCTYGPPKLTGSDMAAAAREIVSAAGAMDLGYQPETRAKKLEFVNVFLDGSRFRFLSPFYVSQSKEEPRLNELLGTDCVTKLAEVHYENGPPTDFTGPFYLFRVKASLDSSEEHVAVLVFGGASVAEVRGMSFQQRVERAQSVGMFYVMDQQGACEPLFIWPIGGRNPKESVSGYTPRFFGVGYFGGALVVYSLQSFDPPDSPRTYSFFWQYGSRLLSEKSAVSVQHGSAMLSEFPNKFDPFSIVNSREMLR